MVLQASPQRGDEIEKADNGSSQTVPGQDKETAPLGDDDNDERHQDGPELNENLADGLDSGPVRGELGKTRKIILGGVMMCTYFLASATTSSSLLIIPSMSRDLEISELSAQWVASAFTLANGCGLLVAGRLADLYGRKYLFLLGLLINAISSLASAIIRHHIALCIVRAISGLGQALAMPAGFGIVGVTYIGERERNVAFAIMGMGYPVGASLGQVFGGLIAGSSGKAWSYQFFVLSGIAFGAAALGMLVIPPEAQKRDIEDRRVDIFGGVLITASLCLFSFSLTQGGLVEDGWNQAYIPALFAISILLFLSFGLWERYLDRRPSLPPPLIKLSVFQRQNWLPLYLILTSLCAYTAISGWVYMTAIWYQTYKGESPLENVLHVLPAPIMGMFVCLLVPYLAPRVRAPLILSFGGFFTAAACWLFPVQPVGTNYWACEFIANLVNPFGADFTMGIGSIMISNLAQGDEQSVLGAVFQTAMQISGTIGVCLASLIQKVVLDKTGDLHHALEMGWWMLAGFA